MKKEVDRKIKILAGVALGILVLALLAWYKTSDIRADNQRLHQQIASKKQAHQKNKHILSIIKKFVAGQDSSTAVDLKTFAPVVMQDIKSSVGHFGVSLSSMSAGDNNSDANQGLVKFEQNSPLPGLKYVPVSIRGQWENLSGFKKWIDHLQQGPITLSSLTVEGRHFDATVQIYGQ